MIVLITLNTKNIIYDIKNIGKNRDSMSLKDFHP